MRRDVWAFRDFRTLRVLGEGGASSVLHALCLRSGTQAAVKVYHRDRLAAAPAAAAQAAREVRLHAGLAPGTGVVPLWAAFADGGGLYLVQELAEGGDLWADLRRRGGAVPEAHAAARVVAPLAAALAHLHAAGVLHRDVKPENVLLRRDGQVLLADLGLAIDTRAERPVSRVGTTVFMPPEVTALPDRRRRGSAEGAGAGAEPPPQQQRPGEGGECGGAPAYGLPVDVWSLGVLAAEALTGASPFEAPTREETRRRILAAAPPRLPASLSPAARDFVGACLRRDPSARPTAAALLRHPWLAPHVAGLRLPPPPDAAPAAPAAPAPAPAAARPGTALGAGARPATPAPPPRPAASPAASVYLTPAASPAARPASAAPAPAAAAAPPPAEQPRPPPPAAPPEKAPPVGARLLLGRFTPRAGGGAAGVAAAARPATAAGAPPPGAARPPPPPPPPQQQQQQAPSWADKRGAHARHGSLALRDALTIFPDLLGGDAGEVGLIAAHGGGGAAGARGWAPAAAAGGTKAAAVGADAPTAAAAAAPAAAAGRRKFGGALGAFLARTLSVGRAARELEDAPPPPSRLGHGQPPAL